MRDKLYPVPTPIPPHPDVGNLPPCESGIKSGQPCPRPATTFYGFGAYCDEHMAWTQAGEHYDDMCSAVYHAKRFLWKAQVEGLEELEEAIGDVLGRMTASLEAADKALNEAGKKAGVRDE